MSAKKPVGGNPFARIDGVIDVARMKRSRVAVFGVGASVELVFGLHRSGVKKFRFFDPDIVSVENFSRQGHDPRSVGKAKVDAVAQALRLLDSECEAEACQADITTFDEARMREALSGCDVILALTDRHLAQAAANRAALMLGLPLVSAGLSVGAETGEVFWWKPGMLSCYRCVMARRYENHEAAVGQGIAFDPPSDGVTIFNMRLVDAIAGDVTIAVLTDGSPNKYGRLLSKLGDRQLIQIMLDPDFRYEGRDLFRELLQAPEGNDRLFCWVAVARRDNREGAPECPDCMKYRMEALFHHEVR